MYINDSTKNVSCRYIRITQTASIVRTVLDKIPRRGVNYMGRESQAQ